MGDNSEEARARAEAKFQKQQKAAEAGVKATQERAAQARAVDVNTARLKSLRLTKEAADKEAEDKAKSTETSGKTGQDRVCTLTEPYAVLRRMVEESEEQRLPPRKPRSRVSLQK